MKISKLLLALSSVCFLASCGQDTPIKPDTSGSITSHPTSATMPDITSDYSNLMSGISKYELNLAYEEAKESIIKITGANLTLVKGQLTKDESGADVIKYNAINAKQTLYENSVLISSFTAATEDDFSTFNYYDATLGCMINSYVYVDFEQAEIKSRDVYKKTNEAVNSVVEGVNETYSPDTYGTYFNVGECSEITRFDVQTATIEMAGKFENGEIFVRFLSYSTESSKTVTDEYGTHNIWNKCYDDFVIKGKQLIKYNYDVENYYMTGEESKTKVQTMAFTATAEYETNNHGKFNMANLPEINVNK